MPLRSNRINVVKLKKNRSCARQLMDGYGNILQVIRNTSTNIKHIYYFHVCITYD
jgi:hypothetical protein